MSHAIANEYKASLIRDLFRREVTERRTELFPESISEEGIHHFLLGWAIAKGLTIVDANNFAQGRVTFSQQAEPRRLL